jgi:hypothetical protein
MIKLTGGTALQRFLITGLVIPFLWLASVFMSLILQYPYVAVLVPRQPDQDK